jgi:hypothetical protein
MAVSQFGFGANLRNLVLKSIIEKNVYIPCEKYSIICMWTVRNTSMVKMFDFKQDKTDAL